MPGPRLYRSRRRIGSIVVLVGVAVALVFVGFWFQRAIYDPLSTVTGHTVARPEVSHAATTASTGAGNSTVQTPTSAQLAPTPTATPLPTLTGNHRINVLLLGSDTDAKFGGNFITQIMMVASIDPVHHTFQLFSIPRDFWVPIPGHGFDKIQIAYAYGHDAHSPDGGIALARQTIEDDFGIRIDHYAWIGLEGFIRVVNTAGGVNIDVMHPMLDDNYPDDIHNGKVTTVNIYATRRLYIPAGPQHLDGATALEYVRTRHGDLIGDFGRSMRQQQVLRALRKRIQNPVTLLRIPQYLSDLKGYLRTDFSLGDLLAYGNFLRQYPHAGIHQLVLMPPTYSSTATITVNGLVQDIVRPNWAAVHDLVARQFAPPGAARSSLTVSQLRIGVENGTSIPGLAAEAARYLQSIGYTVDPARSAAKSDYTSSEVLVYQPQAMEFARMIALPFNATVVSETGRRGPYGEDLVIVLGRDYGTFKGF